MVEPIKWIPIKEEHPGNKIVLVLPEDTFLPPTVASWECGYGFHTVEGNRRVDVAYWMPIPPRPREAERGN